MSDLNIRIYSRDGSGKLIDTDENYELTDFGGVLPAIGDKILGPWVVQGLERNIPENRELYTVVERIFNPRDMKDYVVLVCSVNTVSDDDASLVPPA